MFSHSLFEEISLSLVDDSTVLTNWFSRDYYDKIGETNKVRIIDLQSFTLNKGSSLIISELNRNGITSVDFKIPQILRACMKNANNIEDVILNALKIRKLTWARKMRDYFKELLVITDLGVR